MKLPSCISLCLLLSLRALAASPENGTLAAGHEIPRAIEVHFTPRGQRYIYDHFQEILFRNGFSFEEGDFPSWSYRSSAAFDLDHLPPELEKHGPTFRAVRDVLRSWAHGMSFQNPNFQLTIAGVSYDLKFKRFSLAMQPSHGFDKGVADPDGLTLLLDAEIPQLHIRVDRLRAMDSANPIFGEFGLDALELRSVKGSQPLTFRMPLHFSVADDGALRIRADSLATNLNQVRLEASFKRPLVLPEIDLDLRINKRRVPLDPEGLKKGLEKQLLAHQKQLIQALLTTIKANAETQFPAMINAAIEQRLNGGFTDVSLIDPPGAVNPTARDQFRFALSLKEMRMEEGTLRAGLSASVEDPRRAKSPPLPADADPTGPIRIPPARLSSSDAAISIDTLLLNRVLQLSFDRGYYKTVKTGPLPADVMTILRAPVFKIVPGLAPDQARIAVRVGHAKTGIGESIAIKGDTLPIDMEMDVRLRPNGQGGVKAVMERISKATPDPDYIRVFASRVEAGVKLKVDTANADYRKTESVFIDHVPIPAKLMGIPASINGYETQPNGHALFYLEFAQ